VIVAREILETSFAQFQADRAVVGLATKVRRNEEGLHDYAEAMHCHLGDFREYAALRALPRRRSRRTGRAAIGAASRAEAALSLEALRSATSSASRPAVGPGGPSSCSLPEPAGGLPAHRASSPRTSNCAG
jgi:hypothetical protein